MRLLKRRRDTDIITVMTGGTQDDSVQGDTNVSPVDSSGSSNTQCVTHARPARAPQSFDRKLAMAAACLVASFVIADVALRFLPLGPHGYDPPRFEPNGVPFTRIENGPHLYQPSARFASVYDLAGDARGYFGSAGRIEYEINSLGLRGPLPPVEKGADVYRVICLGDSFTFGEGVKEGDTWPRQLERLLASRMPGRRVEVINAGIQAYDTKDAAALYLLKLAAYKPDAVILGFCLNDATDAAETIRQNEATKKGFERSPLARVSRIAEIVERRRATDRLQREFFDTTRRGFDSPKWQTCRDVLTGMARVSKEDAFRFVVAIFPIFWSLDDQYPFADLHTRIAGACQTAGCECVDLLPIFRSDAAAKGRTAEAYWVHPTDQHPNEIACRLAAERIAAALAPPK
ncbi:MAG: hypothetical protein DCC66_04260 [Planctomycetota bacterium]|nr:MAG: hypothetical protein DCC66_04260 [Planctomycetota bacterium]